MGKILQFPNKLEENSKKQHEFDSKSLIQVREASFLDLIEAIRCQNIPQAGVDLTYLFGLTLQPGLNAAEHFAKFLASSDNALERAKELRIYVNNKEYNKSLLLLHECFGLSGPDALVAVETLSGRFTSG